MALAVTGKTGIAGSSSPRATTARGSACVHQCEVVTAELRRRVGGTFTLAMLADAYAGSDAWTRQAIEEHAATQGWARSVAMVGDAAFHVYARGAVDYTP